MGIRENTFGTITPVNTDYIRVIDDPAGAGDSKNILISALETLLNNELSFLSSSGWRAVSGWTYASTSSVNVASGAASIYSVGDKVRFQNNDSGTWIYNYIKTVADTVLTFAIPNVPNATLTDCGYSKAENPLGFPHWFDWSGANGINMQGFTGALVTDDCSFMVCNGLLTMLIQESGTSNAATMTGTLPIAPIKDGRRFVAGRNGGNYQTTPALASLTASSTTLTFYKDALNTAWTNSDTKGIYGSIIQYRIV